VQFA